MQFLRDTAGRRFLLIAASMALFLIITSNGVLASSDGWVDRWWDKEGEGVSLPEDKLPRPVIQERVFCAGMLRLKSAVHGEEYEFRFRDTAGNYDPRVLMSLYWFLRCKDSSWVSMDIRLIEMLNYISALLGVPVIQVNSGYRSPRYNRFLAASNENVARNSLHQYGQALDFCVPGVPIKVVCSYALYARNAMGYGGIGYYPNSGFVHLDSGRIKQWVR